MDDLQRVNGNVATPSGLAANENNNPGSLPVDGTSVNAEITMAPNDHPSKEPRTK